jgi:transposase
MQTVEAIIDENGTVRLLENVRLPQARKAVLTILDDAVPETESKQSLAEKWSDNQEFLKAMSEAYADDDAEEKEFLRLMQRKQMQILDEWK